jgi:anthranilate phosphoribosyltransferase
VEASVVRDRMVVCISRATRQYRVMQDLEQHLNSGGHLSPAQVREAAAFLLDPMPEAERKASFLRALARKGETPQEIAGFVDAFLEQAVPLNLAPVLGNGPLLDVVGTGGDGLNLFNVSSTAMFILAAGGVSIAKHGNRGITGRSGGADVLEALGVKIDLEPEELARCIKDTGLGFVFAPKYHPAFKAVAEARKLLATAGQRSIFNILGPLLNPARPSHQLIGVFDPRLVPVFAEILQHLGRQTAWVVHGETGDGRGMDELSTLSVNHVTILHEGKIEHAKLDPASFGFAKPALADLAGDGAAENASTLEGVLSGAIKGPKRDLAVFNAAAGFVITGKAAGIAQGRALAEDLLNRGAAHVKLRQLVDWC